MCYKEVDDRQGVDTSYREVDERQGVNLQKDYFELRQGADLHEEELVEEQGVNLHEEEFEEQQGDNVHEDKFEERAARKLRNKQLWYREKLYNHLPWDDRSWAQRLHTLLQKGNRWQEATEAWTEFVKLGSVLLMVLKGTAPETVPADDCICAVVCVLGEEMKYIARCDAYDSEGNVITSYMLHLCSMASKKLLSGT